MDLKWQTPQASSSAELRAVSLERSGPGTFFNPAAVTANGGEDVRLTSALQLISAAVAVSKRSSSTPPPQTSSQPTDDAQYDQGMSGTTVIKTARTIVASDNEVSNGFVKDGKRLPYVFEATESGNRKRSSKILPVCGVCGKRFVCVTTMKRHLVTHTGEKPFSCKVCGKQYTQKGNLRVHERTHRNDRPFECNICHQKFYRKEPMQKHQWRQHGIVHFKGRPPGSLDTADNHQQQQQPQTQQQAQAVAASVVETSPAPSVDNSKAASPSAGGVLYNSIVDRIKQQSYEMSSDSSRHLDGPRVLPHHPELQVRREPEYPASEAAANANAADDVPLNLKQVPKQLIHFQRSLQISDDKPLPLNKAGSEAECGDARLSRAAHLVTAAMADLDSEKQAPALLAAAPSEHSEDELTSSSLALTPPSSIISDEDKALIKSHLSSQHPLKLKKMLAHAYQREYEEQQHHAPEATPTPTATPAQPAPTETMMALGPSTPESQPPAAADSPKSHHHQQQQHEVVECQCKGCGHVFAVQDPYNFRCGHCGMKYTSLPTHMIADPLQCIGCCQVFPHKPALKAHQMTSPDDSPNDLAGTERPFRCCKCGYGFRQKAHLQKHQWRIHRRKLAEADSRAPEAMTVITLQDIIDRGVERSMANANLAPPIPAQQQCDANQPLDLSPTKALLLSAPLPIASSSSLSTTTYSSPLGTNSLVVGSEAQRPPLPHLAALEPPVPPIRVVKSNINQNHPLPAESDSSCDENDESSLSASEKADDASPPEWKRQRTSTSHPSLPPIAGLQKPAAPAASAFNLREQMGGLCGGPQIRTV